MKKDHPLKQRLLFLTAFVLFWNLHGQFSGADTVYAETQPPDPSQTSETTVEKVDRYHQQAGRLLLDTVEWADTFFGTDIYTAEVNQTYVRFRLSGFFEEGEDINTSARFKLRLKLPNTEKRFRLTIASDPDTIEQPEDADDIAVIDQLDETDDNLTAVMEYFFLDRNRHNLKFLAGGLIRDSALVGYGGTRYRYLINYDQWSIRFVEQLRWYTDRGWDSRSDMDFERPITDRLFFRTTPALKWREDEPGLEYRWNTSLYQALSNIAALEYQFNTYFDTEVSGRLKETNLRIRYRRRVWREWLIFEVAPQLAWYEERNFKTVPGIRVACEIFLGRYNNKRI